MQWVLIATFVVFHVSCINRDGESRKVFEACFFLGLKGRIRPRFVNCFCVCHVLFNFSHLAGVIDIPSLFFLIVSPISPFA